jgi:hypothetical protein
MTHLHCVISNAANAFGSSICIVLLQPSSSSEASSVKSIQTYRSSFWEAVRKNAGTLAHSSASPCHVPANRRQEQLKMPLPSVPCFFGNCAYKLEAVVQLRGYRRRTIPWAAVPRREMQDGYEERERGGLEVEEDVQSESTLHRRREDANCTPRIHFACPIISPANPFCMHPPLETGFSCVMQNGSARYIDQWQCKIIKRLMSCSTDEITSNRLNEFFNSAWHNSYLCFIIFILST